MRTLLPLIFFLLTNVLVAQKTAYLAIKDSLRIYPLEEYTTLFIDSSARLGIEEVKQLGFHSNFQTLKEFVQEGDPNWAYWLKIPVVNHNTSSKWRMVLKVADHQKNKYWKEYLAAHDYVNVFVSYNHGSIEHYKTGLLVPKSDKTIAGNPYLNAVMLSLPKRDSFSLYIKIQNQFHTRFRLSAELRPEQMEEPIDITKEAGNALFYIGVSSILALLSFFFFLFVKDWSYLFFGLFALFLALHYMILHPSCLFIKWFLPEYPWLREYFWIFLTHSVYIFFAQFGRSFLDLRNRSKGLDNLLLISSGIILFAMIGSLIGTALNKQTILAPLFFVTIFGVILIGIRIFFLPEKLAKIFGAGAAWLCLFALMGYFWQIKILPLPFNPWPISQMGLMIIYTMGLAYKLQLNEKAKYEAQKVLELDTVKSRFFANISHEFRTPLTLILGPLKKAQEQLPMSELDQTTPGTVGDELTIPIRHISMMRRNAERLQQLINQLLDLSKLENGSMHLQVAEGDIIQFLKAIVFSFESLAERQQIHFQTEFSELGQKAYFDKDKLEKIVVNLLSNAFKYTPEKGKISVQILLENGRIKVSIEDSGSGISKRDLDKIFNRFYQIEGTEDKGTGIGLSLVKELVDLHKGQIIVESQEGKGTVFRVSMPITKEAFHEKEVQKQNVGTKLNQPYYELAAETENSFPGSSNGSNPLLLIVEDNSDLRLFIAETMQKEYQILTAENGKRGLDMALQYIPDLIISDVMMPELNGMDMCTQLKQDERTSHIPIILLTAKAGQQHKVKGLETGADDYLTKPFDEKELLARAKNLVEQRQRLQERFAHLKNTKNFFSLKPSTISITTADERFLKKVTKTIEDNLDNEFFCVEDFAKTVAFSRSQLHRKLKALTGKSPTELIREFRLNRAKELLEEGAGNVSQVAIEVGYSSLSYFTRSFKQAFGISPSEV